MQRKDNFLPVFFLFLLISILIFSLGKTGILEGKTGFLETILSPFQKITFGLLGTSSSDSAKIKVLKDENFNLAKKIADQKKLRDENNALRDQFQNSNPNSLDLLPANIIGAPKFIPGLTFPEFFIIDKGANDGVKIGNALVFKDNLIGKVTKVTQELSEISLIMRSSSSFTGQTQDGVVGIVKGLGNNDIVLDNVLLSDIVHVSDLVLTKGETFLDGSGIPPGLVVGKVVSVDKNPSSLFQKSKLKSLLNFTSLSTVFVVIGQ